MVKLSTYSLSIVLCLGILMSGCNEKTADVLYKRIYTVDEKEKLFDGLLNSAGTDRYYQGSVGERMVIYEGAKYKTNNAWVAREIGVPYLKRGFAAEAFEYYKKAIENDPEEWLGYQAYCWLYFYRDYENALEGINKFDALTPNFTDYPQSSSVDYMRGLIYLKQGKHEDAVVSLEKHLNTEIEAVGPAYIDAMPYQLLAIAYHDKGDYNKADEVFREGIKHNPTTADLYYYLAINLLKLERKSEAMDHLDTAQKWLDKGSTNQRGYVQEFYAIYKEDIAEIKSQLLN